MAFDGQDDDGWNWDFEPEPPQQPLSFKLEMVEQRHFVGVGDCQCGGTFWEEEFVHNPGPAKCGKCGKEKRQRSENIMDDVDTFILSVLFGLFFTACFIGGWILSRL
ncbi:hypothetical protein [Henriciella pelagia]|uniref:hypothetical protein n=1 Tax=Henriciella pelagia TaxID=1977912 RepID=UPI0035156256